MSLATVMGPGCCHGLGTTWLRVEHRVALRYEPTKPPITSCASSIEQLLPAEPVAEQQQQQHVQQWQQHEQQAAAGNKSGPEPQAVAPNLCDSRVAPPFITRIRARAFRREKVQ
jgi:hypothetical protein